MHKAWRLRNRCPYCTAWHVVNMMLQHHLETNQCGLVPDDWANNPPKEA